MQPEPFSSNITNFAWLIYQGLGLVIPLLATYAVDYLFVVFEHLSFLAQPTTKQEA